MLIAKGKERTIFRCDFMNLQNIQSGPKNELSASPSNKQFKRYAKKQTRVVDVGCWRQPKGFFSLFATSKVGKGATPLHLLF